MKKILSIKGGGIRGIIPCVCLAAIEKQTGKLTRDLFDYVSGTSTGALLTATIAAGVPASDSLKVYTEQGPTIFHPANSLERNTLLVARGYQFDNAVLRKAVGDTLGANAGMTVNESPIDLMIPAVDTLGHVWYFVRDAATNAGTTGKYLLADVAVASACATTYHGAFEIPALGYFADGGCGGQADPVYMACAEAFRGPSCYGTIDPAEAIVISLGTGTYTPAVAPGPPKGLLANISWVTSSLVDSSETLAEQAANRQWPGILHAFNVAMASEIDEADVAAIPTLLNLGSQMDWKTILGLL
jgi:hypothetical protein